MAKYNIAIPMENPQATHVGNRFRMCNVYQTDDPDDCIEELTGYLLDHFPANIEVKGTTKEEDEILMAHLAVAKAEVDEKLKAMAKISDMVTDAKQS